MLLFENIGLAVSGLIANKMRALLTMLGIIIGIGSVIAIMTVGNSMTSSVTSSMQSMGANNITVSLTQKGDDDFTQGGMTLMFRPQRYEAEDLISNDMIALYRETYPNDIYAIGLTEQMSQYTISVDNVSVTVNGSGVNEETQKVSNIEIVNGRFLNAVDETGAKPVAVVSDVFCEKLFPGQDPVGKSFDITEGSKVYTVYIVGVYKFDSMGMVFGNSETPTTSMYIPVTTAKQILGADAGYSSLTVVSSTDTNSSEFMEVTERFFASFYKRNNSFTAAASSMESLMESLTEMMNTMSLAISVIAGISLLVGGIGVMNIMLVSITERTREIGTRKALGATNGSIRVQFIVESVIICLIGGIIGIGVGIALGGFGASLLGYAASPDAWVIMLAVGFSMAIGVFFGYYPANKAAKMDPIEALRYE